ncbi:MAG TPA: hypothetical protein VFD57_04650 [Clostridia bacterium]|nr:hypothetical protein [Clostridia bacterium]
MKRIMGAMKKIMGVILSVSEESLVQIRSFAKAQDDKRSAQDDWEDMYGVF